MVRAPAPTVKPFAQEEVAITVAPEDARISWLRVLLIATAAALPFVALSQVLAYPSVLLTIWILMRDPKRLSLCPRWHWVFALVFVLFCIGSVAWGVEGARSLSRLHRLSLLLLMPAVAFAFAGRAPLPLVGGLVLGSVLSAAYDMVRVPLEVSAAKALLDSGSLTTEEFNKVLLNTGSMTTPQFYLVGLLLLLAIPPRLWSSMVKRAPWAWGLALVISGFGLIIHFKRGTWLAFALAVVLLSLLRQNRRILSALLLGVALILAIPATRDRVKDMATMLNPNKGDRAALWSRVAPPLLREHPWGYGYKAMRPRDLQAYHPVQPKLNHLHNNVLQIAGELGWIGGAFWTVWMLAAWGASLAAVRRAAGDARALAAGVCAAFTGLLANGMVEYNFGDTEILMLFALLLGMIARSSAPPGPVDVAGKGT